MYPTLLRLILVISAITNSAMNHCKIDFSHWVCAVLVWAVSVAVAGVEERLGAACVRPVIS